MCSAAQIWSRCFQFRRASSGLANLLTGLRYNDCIILFPVLAELLLVLEVWSEPQICGVSQTLASQVGCYTSIALFIGMVACSHMCNQRGFFGRGWSCDPPSLVYQGLGPATTSGCGRWDSFWKFLEISVLGIWWNKCSGQKSDLPNCKCQNSLFFCY